MTDLSRNRLVSLEGAEPLRGAIAPPGPFRIELLTGAHDVLHCLGTAAPQSTGTVFQTRFWLKPHFAALARAQEAQPVCLVARTRDGGLALALPLLHRREGGLSVLRSPSLGVSDYGGPLIGPRAPTDRTGARRLWHDLRAAMPACDAVHIENMPIAIGNRDNPLALLSSVVPARHQRNVVAVNGDVDKLLRSRGKHYLKEARRCERLLHQCRDVAFERAQTEEEIAAAYSTLRAQQAERRRAAGDTYILDDPAYDEFYLSVLRSPPDDATAHLFTLSGNGEVCAALLGVARGSTFTLLRISTAGGTWLRMSPGRLIIIEAMRYFTARGMTTFDMGIGEYAFKDRFGAEGEPLVSLSAALSLKGWPHVLAHRAKAGVRRLLRPPAH